MRLKNCDSGNSSYEKQLCTYMYRQKKQILDGMLEVISFHLPLEKQGMTYIFWFSSYLPFPHLD